MTMLDCWITSQEQTGFLPEGHDAYFNLKGGIQSGRCRGDQVGPLIWSAEMSKAEILVFLDEMYGSEGVYEARNAGPMEHLADKQRAARAFVAALCDDQPAKVTADEF